MDWRAVVVFYRAEIRGALRERTIVVNSILIPLLLYPGIVFVGLTFYSIFQSRTAGFESRVVMLDAGEAHRELAARIEEHDGVTIASMPAGATGEEGVRTGKIDAVVAIQPSPPGTNGLKSNFEVHVTFDSARERSAAAQQRIDGIVGAYRQDLLAEEAAALGVRPAEESVFALDQIDQASEQQIGAFLLGLVLPLTFVIMVAIGCFNPAIDATAGERERNTWETTLTLATSRTTIVTAKYLFVVTFGAIAGVLNLAALTVSMRAFVAPLFAANDTHLEFSIRAAAWPILILCAVMLAAVIGAAMMLFASFARTFREGQSLVMPVYLLTIVPILFLNDPGLELTPRLALIPIGNTLLVIREVISGHWPLTELAITVGVQLAVIALCVRLAAEILRFEDVVLGSYSGSFMKLAKSRLLRRTAAPAVDSTDDP